MSLIRKNRYLIQLASLICQHDRIFCFVLIIGMYMMQPMSSLSFQHDALSFFLQIKHKIASGEGKLFHPHHLYTHHIYYYVTTALYGVMPNSDIQWLVIRCFRFINLFFTVISLMFLCKIGDIISFKRSQTTLVLLGAAFSFSTWSYATGGEIYTLPTALLLGSFVIALRYASLRMIVVTGITTGVGILCHLMVLAIIPAIVILLMVRQRFSHLFVYAMTVFIVVSLGYGVVINAYAFNVQQTIDWIWPQGGHTPINLLANVGYLIVGYLRAIISGFFLLSFTWVRSRLSDLFPMQYILDDFYLIDSLSPLTAMGITAGVVVLMGLILALLIRSIKKMVTEKHRYVHEWGAILILFLSLIALSVFIKDAVTTDQHVMSILLFWIIIAHGLGSLNQRIRNVLVGSIVVSLVAVNYFGAIKLLANQNNDLFFSTTIDAQKVVGQADLIVVDLARNYAPYFLFFDLNPEKIRYISHYRDGQEGVLRDEINNVLAANGSVYISRAVLDSKGYMQRRYAIRTYLYDALNEVIATHTKSHTTAFIHLNQSQ